ncbi:hypothetical protein GCM10010435_31150 [Winogradskya consettensis]|uniref:Uncharacterized protein n=1 Tax=Winogradskya consettensis TaxID=113560 RepID=A0A919SG82_9ACTN|nr:hypothetical protein Aco04nite_20350 [Actinoplanes consettensis]
MPARPFGRPPDTGISPNRGRRTRDLMHSISGRIASDRSESAIARPSLGTPDAPVREDVKLGHGIPATRP